MSVPGIQGQPFWGTQHTSFQPWFLSVVLERLDPDRICVLRPVALSTAVWLPTQAEPADRSGCGPCALTQTGTQVPPSSPGQGNGKGKTQGVWM